MQAACCSCSTLYGKHFRPVLTGVGHAVEATTWLFWGRAQNEEQMDVVERGVWVLARGVLSISTCVSSRFRRHGDIF
jgi:hypothetical protein